MRHRPATHMALAGSSDEGSDTHSNSSSVFTMSTTAASCESVHCETKKRAKSVWRLVWCHDRYQQLTRARTDRRKAFEEATAASDAELMYLRKACHFEAWCRRQSTIPYILLTDWREAKPCMEVVVGLKAEQRPVFMVVICEVSRERTRATRWAQSLATDAATPLYIHHNIDSQYSLVDGLIARLNDLVRKDAMLPPPQPAAANDFLLWPVSASSHQHSPMAAPAMSNLQQHPASDSPSSGLDQGVADAWPSQRHEDTTEEFRIQSSLPLLQEVTGVLQPIWERCPSNFQMEQLLRGVMPDSYDD